MIYSKRFDMWFVTSCEPPQSKEHWAQIWNALVMTTDRAPEYPLDDLVKKREEES